MKKMNPIDDLKFYTWTPIFDIVPKRMLTIKNLSILADISKNNNSIIWWNAII